MLPLGWSHYVYCCFATKPMAAYATMDRRSSAQLPCRAYPGLGSKEPCIGPVSVPAKRAVPRMEPSWHQLAFASAGETKLEQRVMRTHPQKYALL
jgi:hypothetical protein